ncbi:MAG: hypothetical protein J6C33_08215 [Lachnospiraceae bacterium]|nr:hypothetical protein [Lachnospiraceae bacterium]
MAERPAFFIRQAKVVSKLYSFEWFPGFSLSQKQKSIESLHHAILKTDEGARPLEISTKGRDALGRSLSAFHLTLHNTPLENIFQSAKVFENGGPYPDLLKLPPKEAKRDTRLRSSGSLKAFHYCGKEFPIVPKTAFYDYIYIAAVKSSFTADTISAISSYDYFTDIEFNPRQSVNTQARSVPLIKLIVSDYGYLPDFSEEEFIRYHKEHVIC